MKKFFLFRSSGSENKDSSTQFLNEKSTYSEDLSEKGLNNHVENSACSPKGLFSKSRKQSVEVQSPGTNAGLRRSRSLSTAAAQDRGYVLMTCASDRSSSPFTHKSCTPSSTPTKKTSHSSRRSITPDRKSRTKQIDTEAFENLNKLEERPRSSISHASIHDLSGHSSLSSSNISSKVVDRYIVGEQHDRRTFPNDCSQSTHSGHGQEKSRRPPRAQYTAPSSPASTFSEKPYSHSFRDVGGHPHNIPFRDWAETGYFQVSPRKIAKNVIEKLSKCNAPNTSPKDSVGAPITIDDIYVGSVNNPSSWSRQKPSSLDGDSKSTRNFDVDGLSSFHKNKMFVTDTEGYLDSLMNDGETEDELQTSLKVANDRAMFLSEEFEQQRFHSGVVYDEPSIIQSLKTLAEEKLRLAFEVSSILQKHIADRAKAKEELRHLKTELYNHTRRLEREKNDIQVSLEKELDRRSSDWSLKLEKYQIEEYRLRERVRELAEQNVAMQREISVLKEKESESQNTATHSEQQLKDQTWRLEELMKQNQDLSDSLGQLKDKYKSAADDRDCFHRNCQEKEDECKDLCKSITRLMRTTSEQEKTISELRDSLNEKLERESFGENNDKNVKRLHAEQIRLIGVEQALRKEVESHKLEADSLRRENIDLINRIRGVSKEGYSYTLKLDQEMWGRIRCLQNQGLALLNDSTQLCSKLQGLLKWKAQTTADGQQLAQTLRNGLDGQFIIECDVKIQGYKRRIESLTRSLQTMSVLLKEKMNIAASDEELNCSDDDLCRTKQTSERILKSELISETLLTNLLREKLHIKELELEQLQAEFATAVRGNDVLKSEVQNALDSLSSASHTMKELEFQNLKKDENISQIQKDLQQSRKELTIIKGILPKVTEERDLMWEEVKQYSEKNMLLNSENNALKKKIEALDEDVLVKEGQISILRDNLGRKHFDLLDSPNSAGEFLLD